MRVGKMSDKRFTLELVKKDIYDRKTNTFYCDIESVCDLLNKLQARSEFLEDNCLAYDLTIKHLNGIIEEYEKQFKLINEKIDEYIKTADTYRIPISSLKYGDELGYFNGVYQYMKKLKETINNECELDDE